MSEEKKILTRKEKKERAAKKTQAWADQIWAYMKTQIPACTRDGMVSMKTLANVGDTYINQLARKWPQEKALVIAAAIVVRNEMGARFEKWATDLQKPPEEPKKEEGKTCPTG